MFKKTIKFLKLIFLSVQYLLIGIGILGLIALPLSQGKLEFVLNVYALIIYAIVAVACSLLYDEKWDFHKKLIFLRFNIFFLSSFLMVTYICHNLYLDVYSNLTDFLEVDKLRELKSEHWVVLVPLLLISTYFFSKLVEELELLISSKLLK